MYLLPKIHKGLDNLPGRPIILNCGTLTEKAFEFLDHHLQPIMRSWVPYVKDTESFLSKLKGTVMQTEKPLINDRLRVSKVSWKFRVPVIYNFTVIHA